MPLSLHPNHTGISMSAVVLAVFGLFFMIIPPLGIALLVFAIVQQGRQTALQGRRRATRKNDLYMADAQFQQRRRQQKVQAFRNAR